MPGLPGIAALTTPPVTGKAAGRALQVRERTREPFAQALVDGYGRPDSTAFAQWSAGLFASSKAVIAAAQGAASDPALLELRAEADGHRRAALDALVGTAEVSGALRAGLSRSQAADRAWILTGVELYFGATDGCGWSDTAYSEWLAELLISQLLAPGQ